MVSDSEISDLYIPDYYGLKLMAEQSNNERFRDKLAEWVIEKHREHRHFASLVRVGYIFFDVDAFYQPRNCMTGLAGVFSEFGIKVVLYPNGDCAYLFEETYIYSTDDKSMFRVVFELLDTMICRGNVIDCISKFYPFYPIEEWDEFM